MRRSMKRVSGAAAVLAVAAALALCGPAASGDAQPLPGEAQPAGGESGAQDEAARAETAQADGGQAEAAQSDGATAVSLSYSAHVSNIGWMGAVAGGETAGTTGRGLPLEALRLVLSDASTGEPLGTDAISVEAHVSNVGWQPAVGNGGTAGTTGRGPEGQAVRRAVRPLHRLVPRPLRGVRLAGLGVRRRRRRIGWLRPRRPGRPGRGPAQGRPRPGRHYLSF